MIRFSVDGIAKPGGSKRGFAFRRKNGKLGVALADASGQAGKDWRASVAHAARLAMEAQQLPLSSAPLAVEMTFRVLRPKGHFRTGKNAHVLRDTAPASPTNKPDVLKLARSAEDACTGIIWRDDSQTVQLSLAKVYADRPGVDVVVSEILCRDEPII